MLQGRGLNKASASYCPANRLHVCAGGVTHQEKWLKLRHQLILTVKDKRIIVKESSWEVYFTSVLPSPCKFVFPAFLAQGLQTFLISHKEDHSFTLRSDSNFQNSGNLEELILSLYIAMELQNYYVH